MDDVAIDLGSVAAAGEERAVRCPATRLNADAAVRSKPDAAVRSKPDAAVRSKPDAVVRRVLGIRDDNAVLDESSTHRIFSASILLSALRCLLSYVILPVVLPAIGVASNVGPAVGIPVGVLALVFDVLGVRRFWLADHRRRWAFTGLYAVVAIMVVVLVAVDVSHVV